MEKRLILFNSFSLYVVYSSSVIPGLRPPAAACATAGSPEAIVAIRPRRRARTSPAAGMALEQGIYVLCLRYILRGRGDAHALKDERLTAPQAAATHPQRAIVVFVVVVTITT